MALRPIAAQLALSLAFLTGCAGQPAPAPTTSAAPPAAAPTLTNAEPATPSRCSAAEHHQLDFEIGTWDVRDLSGKLEGTNVITRELDGCALLQRWTSAEDPQVGVSYSGYDARTKRWYHHWIDNWANTLFIQGGWSAERGRMEMTGERVALDGKSVLERVIVTPLEPGKVRVAWDYSPDGGKTWKVRFEGIETRRKP